MVSKRSGTAHGKIGLPEKIRPCALEQIKMTFLAKTQRREEKHKHNNLFSASSRLCENYF